MVCHEGQSLSIKVARRMCVFRQGTLRCARNLFRTIFIVYFLLRMAQCVAWASIVDESTATSSVLNSTAHEPKFGERLLPLRKEIVNFRAKIGYKKSALTPKAITNLPRTINSNRNNYLVSQENDVGIQNPESVLTHNSKRSNNGGNKNKMQTTDTYAASKAPTIMDRSHETVTALTNIQREAKQLNRREDTNMDYEFSNATAASISKADRLIEMSTEFFIVPSSSPSVSHSSPLSPEGVLSKGRGLHNFLHPVVHAPPISPRSVLIVSSKNGAITTGNDSATPPTIVSTHPHFTGLRKEPWVVPVLVLAALSMFMMSAFEIFVLFKAWRTSPSRRHVFLGQMLLLGLFACAVLGVIITSQPSLMSCGTIRFGVGVAYALVFAALMVKCVFLISLNGGVYLPAPYLGLLLLFAVLIQVAIGVQWLITQPPEIFTQSVSTSAKMPHSARSISSNVASMFQSAADNSNDSYAPMSLPLPGSMLISLCKTQFSEFLFSLVYVVFLIIFVTVLAIKSRGIRDNYREAPYIGLAIGSIMPIWLGWILCGLTVAERHSDACIAFGLVATSATVFLVMFMPKGRQLAALGKDGLYVEDREEQFSSISRGGSGYSPSFFHFKPIKYGVMGGFPNSTTTTNNGASPKHSSNVINSGDRFALITATTPTYTRMYHYFPAHLTTHTPFCFYPPPLPPLPSNVTQLPAPPTLKHLGTTFSSMPQAHIAPTLRYPGLMVRPEETNLYTTLEPTLSSNPNVYFQRGGAVHPGMMY